MNQKGLFPPKKHTPPVTEIWPFWPKIDSITGGVYGIRRFIPWSLPVVIHYTGLAHYIYVVNHYFWFTTLVHNESNAEFPCTEIIALRRDNRSLINSTAVYRPRIFTILRTIARILSLIWTSKLFFYLFLASRVFIESQQNKKQVIVQENKTSHSTKLWEIWTGEDRDGLRCQYFPRPDSQLGKPVHKVSFNSFCVAARATWLTGQPFLLPHSRCSIKPHTL